MSTLRSMITLFEIQELALTEVSANNELSAMTANNVNEYNSADSLDRSTPNKVSTIRPVISGIDASNAVANAIISEVKTSFPI